MADEFEYQEVAIPEDTGIEYAEGKYIQIIPASAMIPKVGEHQTLTILKAATHYTEQEILKMDWADEVLEIMELVDEHFDERGKVTWDEDEEVHIIKLYYPIEARKGLPMVQLKMRRPSGEDMLVEDDLTDTRLVIKRVAALCSIPRSVARKLAWVDVRTCFDLFPKNKRISS